MSSEQQPLTRRIMRNGLPSLTVGLVLLASGVATAVDGDDALAERRRLLAELPPAEKQELWELQQRFNRLDPEQRDRLRQLHQTIASAPQAEHLRRVMARYAQWLKTLPAGQRADLLTLPPDERIAHIRTLMQQQAASDMRYLVEDKLSDRDLAAITVWMKSIIKDREEEILQKMPMLPRGMMKSRDPEQRVEILIRLLQRFGPRPELLRPADEDIDRLKEQLSPTALKRMENAKQEGRLAELAENWMRAAMVGQRAGPPVDRAELERFYREELDPQEREYLESLPRERMHARLMFLFHAQRYGRGFGPEGSGPGPGPRGGMGGGFRGRPNRPPWPPERSPGPADPRHKPRGGPDDEPR